MRRRGVVNDPSHSWPHGARAVPTPGPLLRLFAGTFGQPELARADTILATTLWGLRDHGFVSFEWATKQALRPWAVRGLWEPSVDVEMLDMIREKEGTRPGLEGALLSALDGSYRRAQERGPLADFEGLLREPTIASREVRSPVTAVVCAWFRRRRFSPDSHVVKRARKELADLGYPPRAVGSRLSRLIAPLMPPQPTDQDIQELRAEAERVVSAWRSFLLDEPDLSHGLLEACGRGISAMERPE